MNEASLPNVIIGGAPKCGTSSLYFWLAAHPEVYGSPKKETFFFADKVNRFNASANVHEHDLDHYEAFFQGRGGCDGTVRGDGALFVRKGGARALFELAPQTKDDLLVPRTVEADVQPL